MNCDPPTIVCSLSSNSDDPLFLPFIEACWVFFFAFALPGTFPASRLVLVRLVSPGGSDFNQDLELFSLALVSILFQYLSKCCSFSCWCWIIFKKFSVVGGEGGGGGGEGGEPFDREEEGWKFTSSCFTSLLQQYFLYQYFLHQYFISVYHYQNHQHQNVHRRGEPQKYFRQQVTNNSVFVNLLFMMAFFLFGLNIVIIALSSSGVSS